jgi:superfamily II DNA or RNA helicase
MTERDLKQAELTKILIDLVKIKKSIHHSFIAGTGFGKSKVIMDLLDPFKEVLGYKKILILVDNEKLRDYNWEEEFVKWGRKATYSHVVEMNTYQTCYKWTKSLDDYLIICDECDFALTPEYSKFFETYKDNNILAMTGYVTESKEEMLSKYVPAVFRYSQGEAQEDKVLNGTNIVFVKFDLSKMRNIEVKYAKGSKNFKTSENESYNYWDKQLGIRLGEESDANAEALLTGNWKPYYKAKALRERAASKRAEVLYEAKSVVDTAIRYKNLVLEKEKSKVVLFTTRTDIADKLSSNSYHNKNSDKENLVRFTNFNSGAIRELSLVDKINRGVNIQGLDHAIFAHFNGSDTKLRQRIGRLLRLNPEDFATIYVLLPYFAKKTMRGGVVSYVQSRTAAVNWAEKMFKGWDLSKSKVIDERMIKSKL